jgi:hypothetical protein
MMREAAAGKRSAVTTTDKAAAKPLPQMTKTSNASVAGPRPGDPKSSERTLAPTPKSSKSQTTRPSGLWDHVMKEDGGAAVAAAPNSVGAGNVPSITNPSDNYSMQKYRMKKKIGNLFRRKTPKL